MKDKNNQNDGKDEEFPAFDYEVPDSDTLKEDVSERNQGNKTHVEHLQRETDEALLRLDGRMQSYERQSIEKSQIASARALTLSWVNMILLIVFVFLGASLYSQVNILLNKDSSDNLTGLTEKQNTLSYKIQLLSEQVESVLKTAQVSSDSVASLKAIAEVEARLSQWEERAKEQAPVANDRLVIEQPVTGQWIVSLFSFKEKAVAQEQAMKLFEQGIQVAISAVQVTGVTWYRLYIGGFTGKKDAEAYAEQTRTMLGLKLAWVAQVE
ncbi:MAG: SPOR domain-containing protein [Methylococcales bacterium]|jgi:cell division protein FtsN|nr:SPOR domain-containing protein [Methylococcales bacterium]MBT3506375.1 SPOR domain-containing protein [Methylococcales bacterium]MBT3699517.1 SPOR domain-containing protein [Methylococcales bacterium]MBT3815247.1 SPOR domain-containing protein [Methylococcales bacterium]MBT4033018.1 SPOR domain-containing protein [Methylococcales bacterium]